MLRQSYLLTVAGSEAQGRLDDTLHASINGEFLKMLKSFINLTYKCVCDEPAWPVDESERIDIQTLVR